jgi:Family of unknown function (DUF6653)
MQTHQRNISPANGPGRANAAAANPPLLMLKRGAIKPAGAVATYAKIAAPVLITAALWSHVWVGTAASVALTLATVFFVVAIARIRRQTQSSRGWAVAVSFGERIWLNRLQIPIPGELNTKLTVLYLAFWTGTLVALSGGFTASVILTATGLIVTYAAMTVYFQNLVQLYRTMKEKEPLYRFWSSFADNENIQVKAAGTKQQKSVSTRN